MAVLVCRFTSLRQGVSYDAARSTVSFKAKQSSFSANDKIFVQGDKALISEPGEWALESATGMLYLWPRDEAAMAAGKTDVVAMTTTRVFDFKGSSWEDLTTAIDVDGIVVSGSDFASEFVLFRRGNDTPLAMREAVCTGLGRMRAMSVESLRCFSSSISRSSGPMSAPPCTSRRLAPLTPAIPMDAVRRTVTSAIWCC